MNKPAFQFDLKLFALVIVMCASVAAMLRYVVMFDTLGFTGSNIVSAVLGVLGLSIGAGILNRGSFVTMSMTFMLSCLALMFFAR